MSKYKSNYIHLENGDYALELRVSVGSVLVTLYYLEFVECRLMLGAPAGESFSDDEVFDVLLEKGGFSAGKKRLDVNSRYFYLSDDHRAHYLDLYRIFTLDEILAAIRANQKPNGETLERIERIQAEVQRLNAELGELSKEVASE